MGPSLAASVSMGQENPPQRNHTYNTVVLKRCWNTSVPCAIASPVQVEKLGKDRAFVHGINHYAAHVGSVELGITQPRVGRADDRPEELALE